MSTVSRASAKMYWKSAILYLLFINSLTPPFLVRAEECSIEGVNDTWMFTVDEISDNFVGTIGRFSTINVTDAYYDDSKYISVSFEDNELTINTTSEFLNYEDEEERTTLTVDILIACDDDQTLTIEIPIRDFNNHDPHFESEHYKFEFFDKMPPSLDSQSIVGIDNDLTNAGVNFAIAENDYFEIEYDGQDADSKKRHYAKVSAKKDIVAPFGETFNLTITDMGEPTKQSTALLTVVVVKTITPEFTQSQYNATINGDLEIITENGPIALKGSPKNAIVNVSEEFEDYVIVTVGDEIKLSVVGNLTNLLNYDQTYVTLKLQAEIENSEVVADTFVLIDVSSLVDNLSTITSEVVETTDTTPYVESNEDGDYDYFTEEPPVVPEGSTEEPAVTLRVIEVKLAGLNSWLSSTRSLTVVVVVFASVTVLVAIFYVRSRVNYDQGY